MQLSSTSDFDGSVANNCSLTTQSININKISINLQKLAETMLSKSRFEMAVSLFCTAITFEPGRTVLMNQLGQALQNIGNKDDAELCFRGVIPDSINEKYFNYNDVSDRVLCAQTCANTRILPGFAAENIDLVKPQGNSTEKKYNQFNYRKTEARESFCTDTVNGTIWFDGFNTIVLDSNKSIFKEHIKGNEFVCFQAALLREPVKLTGTACFLSSRSSNIYYHWMLDLLPKLGVVEKSGLKLDDIDHFIVEAKACYQLESLRLCGVPEKKIRFSNNIQYFHAERMIVPFLRNDLGERVYRGLGIGLASWIPAYLRKNINSVERYADEVFSSSSMNSPTIGKGNKKIQRIFISRSIQDSRNLAEESKVVEELESRGFTKVEFENYSVLQQAQIMSQAEIVIGVHGAGLTNLSFCSTGTRVIEIFGDYVVPCYWALCAVAGLKYTQYLADSVADGVHTNNSGQQVKKLRSQKIQLDVNDFIRFVDNQLEHCG